jgi:putative membrane protein
MKCRSRRLLFALVLGGAAAVTNAAEPAGDAAFVRKALEGGRKEVAEAREVLTRTKREDLRSIAQMLMTEHMNMNAQLETLAAKRGWQVERPSLPPKVTADGRTSAAPPPDNAELDRAFVETQIEEHERTIEMFRRQSTGASDAELRELAAKSLPRLEQHLAALRKLQT